MSGEPHDATALDDAAQISRVRQVARMAAARPEALRIAAAQFPLVQSNGDRVALVVASNLMRVALEESLEDVGFQIVGSTSALHAARHLIRSTRPSVVILDAALGEAGALQLAKKLRKEVPQVAIVIHGCGGAPADLQTACGAGAAIATTRAIEPADFAVLMRQAWL